MTTRIFLFSIVLLFSLSACNTKKEEPKSIVKAKVAQPTPSEKELSESLFQIQDTFQTQDNQPFTLSQLKGKPTIISMIFTHCAFVCPRLTSDVQDIEKKLGADADKVNFVLVSFDSERDIPAKLKEFANKHGLDKNFTLLHGSENTVRNMGVLLDVQFEKDEDGNFAHSNIITVLDPYGIIRFRKEGLGQDHTQTIQEIKKYY
ncbi:MAG: SCO family protein [Bacteroidetes bacterium]|nr:SCO family protein [Bacteroidota bacterium]MBS1740446.1 SCO family protein [Bacteroidota bacterium]